MRRSAERIHFHLRFLDEFYLRNSDAISHNVKNAMRMFSPSAGVLEMGNVEQSSEAWVARSSDRVSQSVFSSVESLNTEASTSSLAGTAPEDEAESGGRKGARLQNSSEGEGLGGTWPTSDSWQKKHVLSWHNCEQVCCADLRYRSLLLSCTLVALGSL